MLLRTLVYVSLLTCYLDSLVFSQEACRGLEEGTEGTIKSPNFPEDYPLGEYCTWIIKVPVGERVVLNFEFFHLEEHPTCEFDYVLVRDGSTPYSPIIGKYCGSSKPARITSTGQWLWMDFISDVSVSKQGFLVRWSATSGPTEELVPESPDCGGELTAESGTIVSPGYPSTYPAGLICKWTLTVPSGSTIRLDFLSFSLENGELCQNDYLEIRQVDEQEISTVGRYCGENKPPTIRSAGNKLLITFLSNTEVSRTGFRATWSAVAGGIVLPTGGPTLQPGVCGGKLSGSGGLVMSPNFPRGYPDNVDCEWVIEAYGPITWKFVSFYLEEDYLCRYDFVEIRDGRNAQAPRLALFCGRMNEDISRTIQSTSGFLYVRFHSDKGKSGDGFQASWSAPLPPSTAPPTTIPTTLPTTQASACGGKFTSEEGTLVSPGYPARYLDNLDCTWTIEVAKGKTIALSFNDFDLEAGLPSGDCRYDYLSIRDGASADSPELGIFCGDTSPSFVQSKGSELRLRFISDKSTSGRGFELTWMAFKQESAGKLTRNETGQNTVKGCNTPLVQNMDDQDFKVSSTWYSSGMFGGHRARLNLREWPSGWVASKEDKYPSLTIDLKTAHVINAIATQGYARAPHWVTRYMILYKEIGDESGGFVYYRSRGDGFDKIFTANTDSKSIVRNDLDVPLMTSKIIIKPYTWYGNVGLRLELYGCKLERSEQALGLSSGDISDDQLSASSSWNDDPSYGAQRARLNLATPPQGWRPSAQDTRPWIQIKFDALYIITSISTQGYGGQESNWVTQYQLHWTTDDGQIWLKSSQAFLGNSDRNTVENNFFKRPIPAKWVRLYPVSWHNNVGLRLEIYGYRAGGPDKQLICQRKGKTLIGESQPPLQESCGWTLSGLASYDIELKFEKFDFGFADCETDYVEIFSGKTNMAPSLGKFCASNDPAKLTFISLDSMRIQYESSGNYKTRFEIVYTKKTEEEIGRKVTFPDLINEESCGKQSASLDPDSAPGTQPGTWPWQAALMLKGNQVQTCGGTLIARSWVLVAAHCFDRISDPEQWLVRLGDWDISLEEGYEKEFKIKRLLIHPMYSKQTLRSDIALIQLSGQAEYTSRLNPICLPDEFTASFIYEGRVCSVSGWGATEFMGQPVAPLHSSEVPIVSLDLCNGTDSYDGRVPKGVLCAGKVEGNDDSCQGDGGGPLMCRTTEEKYVLAGVTSWGVGCALPQKYGVYTDVRQYMNWISLSIDTD